MKLPKIRELLEAIKALVTGPYTSKFPFKPHEPYSSFRGQPVYNQDKCVGCLSCEEVCPAEAIGHEDTADPDNPIRKIIHFTDTCIFCGCCEAACIADKEGIQLSKEYDLAFFDRKESSESIEKDLQLCEICGSVIACKDHLKWIAEKIGELSFSNPTLYQSRLKSLGILDDNIVSALKDHGRSDRVKISPLQTRHHPDDTIVTCVHRVRLGAWGDKIND